MGDDQSFELEFLGALRFLSKEFEYGKKTYPYSAITGIEYYAVRTKHSVNFIPTGTTHEAYLKIHFEDQPSLEVKQERPLFRSAEEKRAQAVMRAAGIFSQTTFTDRYARYERQFAKANFVEFSNYQFHRDGDVFRNKELLCNIRDKSVRFELDIFQLVLEYPKPFILGFNRQVRHFINLRLNRDCFLRFMNDAYGLTWQGETIPSKRTKPTEVNIRLAIVALCGCLSRSAGYPSPTFLWVCRSEFGISDSHLGESIQLVRAYAANTTSASDVADGLREMFNGAKEPLTHILIGLATVAFSSQTPDLGTLRLIGAAFQIPANNVDDAIVFARQKHRSYEAGRHSELEGCYAALGLKPGASLDDVKAAYREKVKLHHPDLVRSSGADEDQLRESEQIMVVLNAAYHSLTSELTSSKFST